MDRDKPLYEDRPTLAGWLKLMIGAVLGLTLIMGLVFLLIDRWGALALFAVTLLDGLLFYSVIPRAYQVYSDRLTIVLGRPFSKTLYYRDIRSIRPVDGSQALASTGVRFATSTRYVLEISRPGRASVTISPSGGEQFQEQINQAWKNYTGKG
jgi:hypothetical protein